MNLARVLWLPLLLAAATALIACGSDSSGGASSATPSPTATPRRTGPTPVPGPGVTDAQITLGMTNDISGSGDTPYAAITLAMQAYFRKLNAEDGGVCGRDLALLAEDDGYSPPLALEKTRKLVEQDFVLAVVGALSTEGHKEVARYLNDPNADGDRSDGVPDLFLSTAWSGWGDTAQFPWTIGYIPDNATDGAILGRYIAEHFAGESVGILYRDDDFGRDYLAGLQTALPGVSLVARPYPPDAIDVATQVNELKDANAGVVVLASTPEISAIAIRTAAQADYDPEWLLAYANAPSMLAAGIGGGVEAPQLLEGFRLLDGAVSTQFLLSPIEDENDDAMVEHARIMQTFAGPAVSSLSVYGQSLAETVAETLARTCDDLSRAGVLRSAEGLSGYRPSLMLPELALGLGATDHRAVQSLQPVRISGDGQVLPAGDVIEAPSPAPSATPASASPSASP